MSQILTRGNGRFRESPDVSHQTEALSLPQNRGSIFLAEMVPREHLSLRELGRVCVGETEHLQPGEPCWLRWSRSSRQELSRCPGPGLSCCASGFTPPGGGGTSAVRLVLFVLR